MSEGSLRRIRRAVRNGNYLFTDHALEEADDDGILAQDIIEVLLTGDLDSEYSDDPRGTRYVVRGEIESLTLDVVCRFRTDGKILIIITIYAVDF